MEEKLLDPTLIGVVIGALLSLFGNIITQYFSAKKDERQWERQRISSKEERAETARANEIQGLRELYHKCILSLSMYLTKSHDNDDNQNFEEEIKEIHYWLSLLLLRHPHKHLSDLIDSFVDSRDVFDAEDLRKYVLRLVKNEEALIDTGRLEGDLDSKVDKKKPERTIEFIIDESFRMEQMVQGIELRQGYSYGYEFSALSNEQRERLIKMYIPPENRIPNNVQLFLPAFNAATKRIDFRAKPWKANINPDQSDLNNVLELWGKEFDKYLNDAEGEMSAITEPSN